MQILWYGHAAFLVVAEGRRIILDPYTSADAGTWADFLDSHYVNGQLANTGDGCYHVLYYISEDLGGRTESSPAQCGPGTISVSFTTPVDLFTQTEVMVCAGQPDENTDCGPAQWLGG